MQETVLDIVGDKKKSVKQSLSLSIKAETEQSETCAHMKRQLRRCNIRIKWLWQSLGVGKGGRPEAARQPLDCHVNNALQSRWS